MKKYTKIVCVVMAAFCLMFTGCDSKSEEEKAIERKQAYATDKSDWNGGLKPYNLWDSYTMPSGKKIDCAVEWITFDNGLDIDISDITYKAFCDIEELTPISNTISDWNESKLYLRTRPYDYYSAAKRKYYKIDVETSIEGEIVTHDCDPTREQKIKCIIIGGDADWGDAISFCDGQVVFNTPRTDIEALFGHGNEFDLILKEDGEKGVLHVYKNSKATIALKYGDGTGAAQADCVEKVYLFANK